MVSQNLGMLSFRRYVPKRKLQFESLWEECIQEETRVANREALLARDDDQALATHTKGGRKKPYFKRENS
jgi:hypothetical protein